MDGKKLVEYESHLYIWVECGWNELMEGKTLPFIVKVNQNSYSRTDQNRKTGLLFTDGGSIYDSHFEFFFYKFDNIVFISQMTIFKFTTGQPKICVELIWQKPIALRKFVLQFFKI